MTGPQRDYANDLQTCRRHHETIRAMLAEFPDSDAAQDADATFAAFQKLGSVLVAHLRLEDGFLYPSLESNDDRTVRETAARYREEMGGIAAQFTVLQSAFPSAAAVAEARERFLALWKPLRRRLEVRMAKEDNGLYAIAEDVYARDSA